MDDAREKMHQKNPSTRNWHGGLSNITALLSEVKANDPDARHLSASSLRMILDRNHFIRAHGNWMTHNASDAAKKFAVESKVGGLSQRCAVTLNMSMSIHTVFRLLL